ncbi:MAG TPA: PaaI family thioesterase [Thermoanaerobaculia bacterium]|nr:PaaI family thioesterase [Thermoanaerobaculia bacterium]
MTLAREDHYRKLERMYLAAPVTRWYGGIGIAVADGAAQVTIAVREELFHAAGAVHGSVYFRALDDAAFFAANSRVEETLVLTVSFHLHLTRPVSAGTLRSTARVIHESGRLLLAEAELADDDGRLLAKGSGTFSRSNIALRPEIGYA